MSLLIETIKVKNGELQFFEDHKKRMLKSRLAILNQKIGESIKSLPDFDFEPLFQMVKYCDTGIYKCRLLYGQQIDTIELSTYQIKPIQSLRLVEDNNIDYSLKYQNRDAINLCVNKKGKSDDIVIIKNGLLTDSSYCNIALYNGKDWYTPQSPLLAGTMRQRLINDGLLIEKNIDQHDIQSYDKIRLFNAMIAFGDIEIVINKDFDIPFLNIG